MSHSLILKLAAVVSAIFGIALAVAPNELAAVYRSSQMNATGVYNSMLFGGFLIGLAVMDWAASNAESMAEAHYVILGNLVSMIAGLAIAVTRQLSDAAIPSGWVNVGIFLVFAVLFAYLYFSESISLPEGRAMR